MAVSQVASAATSTVLALPNNARTGIKITNTDANRLYVILDSVAATTALYSFYLDSGETWEDDDNYRGEIRGIWAADGSGHANVTEQLA